MSNNQKHEYVCSYCGKVEYWDEPAPKTTPKGEPGLKYACVECDKSLRCDED